MMYCHRTYYRSAFAHGVTLLSLLVGLAVSMVVILAALSLFQRMAKTTGEVRQDAQVNAQRNASLVTAGLMLQAAGFGIADAAVGSELLLLSGASWDAGSGRLAGQVLNTSDSIGNAVAWVESPNIAHPTERRCRVLWSPESGGLKLLEFPEKCTSLSSEWSAIKWRAQTLSNTPQEAIALQQDAETCSSPFGIDPSKDVTPKVRITLTAVRTYFKASGEPFPQPLERCPIQVQGEDSKTVKRAVVCTSVCLSNIPVPSSSAS